MSRTEGAVPVTRTSKDERDNLVKGRNDLVRIVVCKTLYRMEFD